MSNIKAGRDISLNCECPECKLDFDLTEADDFWSDGLDPIENGTSRTTNYEATCPIVSMNFSSTSNSDRKTVTPSPFKVSRYSGKGRSHA